MAVNPAPSIPAPQPVPSPSPGRGDLPVQKSPFRFLFPLLGLILIGGLVYLGITRFLPAFRGGSASEDTVTLTYWGLWEPAPIMDKVINDFQQANPGIKITYQQQKSQDYRERLQSSLQNDSGPDLFRFHHTWVPMLQNQLAPVPDSVLSADQYAALYYPVAAQSLKLSKGFAGIPIMFDGLGLFYNQTLLEAAGKTPPTSWEELRRTAKALTVYSGDQIIRGGVALGNTNNVEHWSDIIGVMLLQNAALPQAPNNKNGQDAVTYYTNFTKLDRVWDDTLPPAVYAFATEKVAMMLAPSWRAHDVIAQNPDLNFNIAPIPQLPETQVNWASFWVEGVSAQASKARQDAAWKFLSYLNQPETLQTLYTSASAVRRFGEPFARTDMADQLKNSAYVGAYILQAPTAQSWYLASFTHDNGLNDRSIKYYEDAVNAVISGTPASEALKTTEQGLAQVLSQYNLK